MHKTSLIVGLVVLVLLGASGYYLYSQNKSAAQPQDSMEVPKDTTPTNTSSQKVSSTATENNSPTDMGGEGFDIGAGVDTGVNVNVAALISFTGAAFTPSKVTIKKGQTVRFVNNSDEEVWPASANHPTHTLYPEKKTGQCLGSAFDACRGLKPGESWDFTFNEVGAWGFHDHLHASIHGTITVTQ